MVLVLMWKSASWEGLQNAAKVERKRRGCYQKGKDAHLLAHTCHDVQPFSGHSSFVAQAVKILSGPQKPQVSYCVRCRCRCSKVMPPVLKYGTREVATSFLQLASDQELSSEGNA